MKAVEAASLPGWPAASVAQNRSPRSPTVERSHSVHLIFSCM
jgi:hypothetical protein